MTQDFTIRTYFLVLLRARFAADTKQQSATRSRARALLGSLVNTRIGNEVSVLYILLSRHAYQQPALPVTGVGEALEVDVVRGWMHIDELLIRARCLLPRTVVASSDEHPCDGQKRL